MSDVENKVIQQGELPKQTVIRTPPTHVKWNDDSHELVYPEGYSEGAIEPLPADFWTKGKAADHRTRSFVAAPAKTRVEAEEEAARVRRSADLDAMTNSQLFAEIERMITEKLRPRA